ncbi:hypothetical protein, partial [Pseudomonas aeruginosa]|uniref:hypothetical protein n=1 Tax=Pseudomonas aeruginosa TaxID=287 RepID=UPI001F2ABCBB
MGTYKKSLKNTLFLWWAATRSIVIELPTCRRRRFRFPGGYGDIASCRSPSVVPRVRLVACMRLRIAPDSNRVMWLLHYAGEDLHPRLVPSDFMIGTKHDSHAHTGEKMPGLAGLMRGRV